MWQFTNPQHSTDKEVLLELPNFPVGWLYVVWRYFFENKRSPKTFFNQLYTLLFNRVTLTTKVLKKVRSAIQKYPNLLTFHIFSSLAERMNFNIAPKYFLFCRVVLMKYLHFMTSSNNTMLQSEKWAPFVSPFADKRQNFRVCEAEFRPWSPLSRFNGIAFKLAAAALLCKGRLR